MFFITLIFSFTTINYIFTTSNRRCCFKRTAGFEKNLNTSGFNEAQASNQIWYTDSGLDLAECDQLDLVIEATGNPETAVDHCLAAFNAKSHVVLVTVEGLHIVIDEINKENWGVSGVLSAENN